MYEEELYHQGIKGQKWGIRRYQNPDGSLTSAGKQRYIKGDKLTARGRREFSNDPEAYRKFAIKNIADDVKRLRNYRDSVNSTMDLTDKESALWTNWQVKAENTAADHIDKLEQRSVQDLQKDAKKAKDYIHKFYYEQYTEITKDFMQMILDDDNT